MRYQLSIAALCALLFIAPFVLAKTVPITHANLFLLYSFDGASGPESTAFDNNQGNASNDGTVGAGTGMDCTGDSGKYSNGCTFDGTNDYIQIGSLINVILTNDNGTIYWWMSKSATGQEGVISQTSASTDSRVLLNDTNNTISYESEADTIYGLNARYTIADGNYHQYVLTWNKSVLFLYVDGQVADFTPNTMGATDDIRFYDIGINDQWGDYFTGSMDEIAIFDANLTPDEIGELFGGGLCTYGGNCSGGAAFCINGTCEAAATCQNFNGAGCSASNTSTNYWWTYGTCLADGTCATSGPVAMNCAGSCMHGVDATYNTCDGYGGQPCDSTANGTFMQGGLCWDDGGVAGQSYGCRATGFIYYDDIVYRNSSAILPQIYDYDGDTGGESCDWTITFGGSYSADGMVISDSSCKSAVGSADVVAVDVSNNNYYVSGCDTTGDYCDSDIVVSGGSPFAQNGACVTTSCCTSVVASGEKTSGISYSNGNEACGCTGKEGQSCDSTITAAAALSGDGMCTDNTCVGTTVSCICGTSCTDSDLTDANCANGCGSTGYSCDSDVGASGFSQDGTCASDGTNCITSGGSICYDGTDYWYDGGGCDTKCSIGDGCDATFTNGDFHADGVCGETGGGTCCRDYGNDADNSLAPSLCGTQAAMCAAVYAGYYCDDVSDGTWDGVSTKRCTAGDTTCCSTHVVDSDGDDPTNTVSATDTGNTCSCDAADAGDKCDTNFDGTMDGVCSGVGVCSPVLITANLTSPQNWFTANSTVIFQCNASSNSLLSSISLDYNYTGAWATAVTSSFSSNRLNGTGYWIISGFTNQYNFSWRCKATDRLNNNNISTNWTINIDNQAPLINFTIYTNPDFRNNTIQLSSQNWTYINITANDSQFHTLNYNNFSLILDWNRSLVGWWRFEEYNNDSSTYLHNLTCSGAECPNLTMGSRGKGYYYNGAANYLNIPYDADLNPDNFTVIAWAKSNGTKGAYMSVVTSRDDSPVSGYILYLTDTNIWQFWVGTGAGWNMQSGPTVQRNVWVQLVGVYNGSHQTFYVNGTRVAGPTATAFTKNSQFPLRVGAGTTETTASLFFNGTIDEVMVFKRALSWAEVNATYSAGLWRLETNLTNLTPGTYTYRVYAEDEAGNLNQTDENTVRINNIPSISSVIMNTSCWANSTDDNVTQYLTVSDADGDAVVNVSDFRLNGTGVAVLIMPMEANSTGGVGKMRDYSQYMNNGSFTGPWSLVQGKVGNAVDFETTTDITIAYASSLNFSGNFSIALWLYPQAQPAVYAAHPIKKWSSTVDATYVLYHFGSGAGASADQIRFYANTTAWGTISAGYVIPAYNQWYHVGLSYNTVTGGQLFINGDPSGARTGSGVPASSTAAVHLGGQDGYDGYIDEVYFFNRSLSNEQMKAIYTAGLNGRSLDTFTRNETISYENWSVMVTPNDGIEDGLPLLSKNVTIKNTCAYCNSSGLNWYVTASEMCNISDPRFLPNNVLFISGTGTLYVNASMNIGKLVMDTNAKVVDKVGDGKNFIITR